MKQLRLILPLLLLLLVFIGSSSGGTAAQTEHPGGAIAKIEALPVSNGLWSTVNSLLVKELLQTDWRSLDADLKAAPQNLAILLARFDLALRRGHRSEASRLLKQIAGRADFAKLELSGALSHTLIGKKEWGLAEDLLRLKPPKDVATNYILIDHIAKTRGTANAESLLSKLAADGNADWTAQWVLFRSRHGDVDALLRQLEDDVRNNPKSLQRAMLYVHATGAAGKSVSLDWMGKVCQIQGAYDSYALGTALLHRNAPKGAAEILEHSLATPVTQAELQQISSMSQIFLPNPERNLRGWTRTSLAKAYKEIGRADLSQQQIEELAKMEREGGRLTPWRAALAGEVQAASGQRVIEDSILQEEKANENSPEYWLTRAKYYAGRKEDAPARHAFEKALALAPIGTEEEHTKGVTVRMQITSEYANYLMSQNPESEIQFLRTELSRPGQSDVMRSSLLNWLLNDYRHADQQIAADDSLLWDVLSQQTRWSHSEGHCLRGMLEGKRLKGRQELPSAEKLAVIVRAEKLCEATDPSRAQTLGGICTRYGYSERAVPLLQDAVARLSDTREKDSANSALLEAYLRSGRAAEAESQLPAATHHLTPTEMPGWIAQVAVVAAKSGDTARALRLWRQVANIDATLVLPVRSMASAGMTQDLQAFYQEQQKTDPASWVPRSMLEHLSRPLTIDNWIEFEAN